MRVWTRIVLLLGLLLVCWTAAGAEQAQNITGDCRITVGKAGKKEIRKLTDGNYQTYVIVRAGGEIVADGSGQKVGSVMIRFYERSTATEVWAGQNGEYALVSECGSHLSEWIPLPENTDAVKLINKERGRMFLAEITVYGTGEKPEDCPEWEDYDSCDLMVVACHPDDELLWLGGLLPTYAGERGLRVQVVYAVPSTPMRRLELLDGLCHCGVRGYPAFLNLPDVFAKRMKDAYSHWGKNKMHRLMTECIRRWKPEVIVTHDLKGEYGHGGHQAVADTVCASIGYAADAGKYPESFRKYGVWQVKKCYIHLYKKGRIQFDWHRPLEAFGGKDGLTVATEALALHRSQVKRGWEMEDGGKMDNSLFGLYYTSVGPDEAGDDLFEHIALPER